MGLISPGSGVRVPPGAESTLFIFALRTAAGHARTHPSGSSVVHPFNCPVGAIEQRVRLLI